MLLIRIENEEDQVKRSELEIWSLQIPNLERIPALNCVQNFFEHPQSTQHG
jgi:hypothetical protein